MKKLLSICGIFLLCFIYIGCARVQLTPEDKAFCAKAAACPLELIISKDKAEEAWSRAHTWIAKYSSMKIQTVTDYILQTYNPVDRAFPIIYAYSLTKTLMGSEVQITIECFSNNRFATRQTSHNAHLLAYYIKTGENHPHLINR
ncbi:MAG: hypothetical protein P9L89_05900 [Candidatus Celaenobacter polaris]|nr:hypothetical protein [Candidatus Celaenobacter polaris]